VDDVRRLGRWIAAVRSHRLATDVALAALLCAATLVADISSRPWHGRAVNGALILAAVAAYGGVLCRRRWPIAAVVVSVAAATAFMALSRAYGWVVVAPLIALYHLAVLTSDRRRLLVAGGLAVLLMAGVPEFVVHASGADGAWLDGAKLAVAAACGLALAAGDGTRSRRAYLAEVEERACRAERDRDEEAHRRVTEERLRIARDLHDSLGHQIAVINAQAGMASHLFHAQPATASQALANIKQASRAALDDLRNTVSLMRQPGEPITPTTPAVGVGGLAELVGSFRGSGMRIDHEIDGPVRRLAPTADQAAYRVVQEALTNVRKHAGGAATQVRLSFQPAALHIVVENDGHSRPGQDGAGHGITGMRERVSAAGGRLDAGPRTGGGYRVSAVLPLPADRRP
jgi:signal transduction histidine kinase